MENSLNYFAELKDPCVDQKYSESMFRFDALALRYTALPGFAPLQLRYPLVGTSGEDSRHR